MEPAATLVTLPSILISPDPSGDDHEFFLLMLVRRMRRHSGFEQQAACSHGFQLIGGAVMVDAKVAKRLLGELRLIRGGDSVRQLPRRLGSAGEGGECAEPGEFKEIASVGHMGWYSS